MEGLIDLIEASKLLNVCERTIRNYMYSGELPAYNIGPNRKLFFKVEDLLALKTLVTRTGNIVALACIKKISLEFNGEFYEFARGSRLFLKPSNAAYLKKTYRDSFMDTQV